MSPYPRAGMGPKETPEEAIKRRAAYHRAKAAGKRAGPANQDHGGFFGIVWMLVKLGLALVIFLVLVQTCRETERKYHVEEPGRASTSDITAPNPPTATTASASIAETTTKSNENQASGIAREIWTSDGQLVDENRNLGSACMKKTNGTWMNVEHDLKDAWRALRRNLDEYFSGHWDRSRMTRPNMSLWQLASIQVSLDSLMELTHKSALHQYCWKKQLTKDHDLKGFETRAATLLSVPLCRGSVCRSFSQAFESR